MKVDPQSHEIIKQAFYAVDNLSKSDREIVNKKLGLILEQYKDHLHFGQNFLASVANLTPFVGLFGTVIGVYLALIDVSTSGNANIAIVAKPIGEALIATAIGLWCAIPASFAYNFYSKKAAFALKKVRMIIEQRQIEVMEKK